ncbi:hypothetical protein ACQR16_27415 [Bradyrhizobium oligotrophicum]|uniref:preATP grasp domain-containing protein n=1 Tax=Bradyrhizobium oligotrophicum TaxID=44255 RepID=UPI003EB917ED
MRLIIANDLDDWIVKKTDIRAWALRILWFAEAGDVIIAMDQPDRDFVNYVAKMKGFDPCELTFYIPGGNRYDGRLFDHLSLNNPEFVRAVTVDVANATDVLVNWSSPLVAVFLDQVGLADRWPGCLVFAQGGAELFNSKATFRALAATADVPIRSGMVCRSVEAAAQATSALLARNLAVVIKTALGSAGAGNHILTVEPGLDAAGAGCKYMSVVDNDISAIVEFWRQHWSWASSSGAYPAIVEAFLPDARTIYAEYLCDQDGARLGVVGELEFRSRIAAGDTVPVRNIKPDVHARLVCESQRLANVYWSLGYRGPISVDALLSINDEVVFTEANAQITGSTHLYRVILQTIAGDGRHISQMFSPESWAINSTDHFLQILRNSGCEYDPKIRRGIIITTPRIGAGTAGPITFSIVYGHTSEREDIMLSLQREFDRQ